MTAYTKNTNCPNVCTHRFTINLMNKINFTLLCADFRKTSKLAIFYASVTQDRYIYSLVNTNSSKQAHECSNTIFHTFHIQLGVFTPHSQG